MARFLEFLCQTAEAVKLKAEEEEVGCVTHEVLRIKERTPTSNGLTCVRITFTDIDDDGKPGEEKSFRLFAGGEFRDKSMIKIEKEDKSLVNGDLQMETPSILVSANSELILAYISF